MNHIMRTVWIIIGFEASIVCAYLAFQAYGIRLSYTEQKIGRDINRLGEELVVLTKTKHDLANRTKAYTYATQTLGMQKARVSQVHSLDGREDAHVTN